MCLELHQNMGVNQNAGFTDALKNIHSDNELSNLFFSRVNIDFLQQRYPMKYSVQETNINLNKA